MNLQKTYPSLLVSDLATAEDWYSKLLGRGPDYRPMPTLIQWELGNRGGLMVSSSEEIAGKGVVFLYVDDLAAERSRCAAWGSSWARTIRAIIRHWRSCAIRMGT